MLDGAGSGYDLGRDAIAAVLHEYDGLGEKTVLTDIVTAKAGAHPKDMIPEIYRGGRAYIASFADTVFEGCRRGDAISLDIMKRNAGYISSLINTAGRLFDGSFAVALGGGILQNYPEFQKEIRSLVPDRISLLTADMPPVFGSVLEAVYSAGGDIESGFKVNFNESYKTFVL
jgi:N-acetylglucosamine kinase-like BadF-type ATPase